MDCMGCVKMGTKEAAAGGFTKHPDHFNLEGAKGDIKGFPPRQYAKGPPRTHTLQLYLFI